MPSTKQRKPEWLKVNLIPSSDNYRDIKRELSERGLYTVCQEAKCPNINECWQDRTATVMILGDTCTRACKFCHVNTGNPHGQINKDEISQTAEMVELMNLRYIVITSVDRDDLPDHGAGHFAAVVERLRLEHPELKVEVLVPDFAGHPPHLDRLGQSDPFVIAQNLETVERLTHPVRDKRAGYQLTLDVLEYYKLKFPHIHTKTSLMLGLGETVDELKRSFDDLVARRVDILTLGQYLQPTRRHLKVQKYYTPQEFDALKNIAYKAGFKFVASGPLVRSSYKAAEYLDWLEKETQNHVRLEPFSV